MNKINDLKKAVSDHPDLISVVNELDDNRIRLAKLMFDLNRLDEAIIARVVMLESIKSTQISSAEIASNCQQLLITISSFINMSTTAPIIRANHANEIFKDLMKRM